MEFRARQDRPCREFRANEANQALRNLESVVHNQTQRLVQLEQKVDLLTSLIEARLPAAPFAGRDQATTTSSERAEGAGNGGLHGTQDDAPDATAPKDLFCRVCIERAERSAAARGLFPPTFGACMSLVTVQGYGASVPLSPSIAATDDFDRLSVSSHSDTVGSSDTDGEVLDLTDFAETTCRGESQSGHVPQTASKPELPSWLESVE